jgi:hypothetical protein
MLLNISVCKRCNKERQHRSKGCAEVHCAGTVGTVVKCVDADFN